MEFISEIVNGESHYYFTLRLLRSEPLSQISFIIDVRLGSKNAPDYG